MKKKAITFNIVKDSINGIYSQEVKGYKVSIPEYPNLHFMVYFQRATESYLNPRGWVLTDYETGARWVTGRTIEEAIKLFHVKLGIRNPHEILVSWYMTYPKPLNEVSYETL